MTAEQALIRIYALTARRLRHQIRQALASDNLGTATYRAHQLEAVNTQLRALGQRTRGLSLAAITEPYRRAVAGVDAAAGHPARASIAFAGANQRAISVLAQNMAVRLNDAATLVGRRTDDAFRRVALQQVAEGIAGGDARREVSRRLQRQLIDEGVTDALTGFVDKRGARWQLDTYTEMRGGLGGDQGAGSSSGLRRSMNRR